MLRSAPLYPALALVCLALAGCRSAPPANVAATVNGRPITYEQLDKAYLAQFGTQPEHPNDDQTMIQRLEILRSLVDAEIMLQRAEKQGLMAADADVEAKFNELKSPFTQEEFQKQLAARKMTVEDVKTQVRKDQSIQKLFNKEITGSIEISDKDISDFYNSNKSSFNLPEPQVRLGQILVTPAPDPNVRNLRNDKAQTEEQARKKIDMIMDRLRKGEDFAMLAQNYSEDPQSAQNGGDMGFIQESALEKANVELRKAVMSLNPGQVTPIIHTVEGYRILKVFTKEPAGQRTLGDPTVQQIIRENLRNRKDQLLKAAYYEVARNESKVVNYFAMTVTANKDKK